MSLIDFVSCEKIKNDRNVIKEARENILANAKRKYDHDREKDLKALKSGEKDWLLPSIEDKLDGGKKKKKSKHSKKKHKKEKRKHVSSDSDSSEEEVWVEKKPQSSGQLKEDLNEKTHDRSTERDDWMEMGSLFKTYTRDELRAKEGTSRVLKRQEERRKKLEGEKPGSHPLELNPYYKKGGEGLPQDKAPTVSTSSTYDAEWLRKALGRAKDQAKAEGKSLEEVAAQRWGSLEKFNELLEAAEKNSTNMWDKGASYSDHRHRTSRYRHERSHTYKNRYPKEDHEGKDRRRDRSRSPRRSSSMRKPSSDEEACKTSRFENNDYFSKSRKSFEERPRRSWKKDVSPQASAGNSNSKDPVITSSHTHADRDRSEEHIFMPKADYRNMSRQDCKKLLDSAKPPAVQNSPVRSDNEISAPPKPSKPVLNDKEMNKLGAKLTKAELLGNTTLAAELKKKLDEAREARKLAEESGIVDSQGNNTDKCQVKEVHLTRTLDSGLTVPVSYEPGKPIKKKKYSKALVEFEDRYNLKEMFESEKRTCASEQVEMAEMAALKMGATNDDDFDDDAGSHAMVNRESLAMKHKQQARAVKEYQATERTLESCDRCLGNPEMQKHMMVSLGEKCYLAVPPGQSMSEGQCSIVPIHHVQSTLLADEDLWEEVTRFKSALVELYRTRDEDCVFFESYIKHKTRIPHMVLHCIPISKELGELAPIYFKKAIDECEAEWAQNKKLVNLSKTGGIRRSIPKGLSYFYVDFGLSPGYAHVIEDEHTFPRNFAQEIIGGMLDCEASLWRKPPKMSFDAQRQKVLKFAKMFKDFDPMA